MEWKERLKRRQVWAGFLSACLLFGGCAQPQPDAGPGEEPADIACTISASGDVDAAGDSAPGPPQTEWLSVPVIAHAMGAVDGRTETNSLDAFLQSYEAGQRVFEVDLQLTSDGRLVARHDWEQISYYNLEQEFAGVMDWETFIHTPISFFYTPVDIDGLVSLMQAYPDVCIVTDSKDTDEASVRAQMGELVRAIQEADAPELWERVIVQVYHEDMYRWVSQETPVSNWIFTLYQIADPDFDEIGAFCQENNIPVVTMASERVNRENSTALHSYGCRVYVHTVNRLRAMKELAWIVDGYYSDYVTPVQLKAVFSGTNQLYLSETQDAG